MARVIIALDVGEKRIGVAKGDSEVRLASPLTTVVVDGGEVETIAKIIKDHDASQLVIGLPRNNSGVETDQSTKSRKFAEKLSKLNISISFQDESLTSVIAEQRLAKRCKNYNKSDVDSEAAAIILDDYLEANCGK